MITFHRAVVTICLIVLCGGRVIAQEPERLHLWLPGNDWAFEIDLSGFNIQKQDLSPELDGRSVMAASENKRVLVSVILSPSINGLSSIEYRDSSIISHGTLQLDIQKLNRFESGSTAFEEYFVESFEGFGKIHQKNVFAYILQEETIITVHVSSMNTTKQDEEIFNELFESIKIISDYHPTTFEYFAYGSYFYNLDNLSRAIEFYEIILSLEVEEHTLSDQLWLITIDNLGMSYGISGDLDNSRRIFEFGLSQRPEYPMFHYNMACVYGEENNLDMAIKWLESAHKFVANSLPGEQLPDPSKDQSFNSFLDKPKFQELMKSVYNIQK